MTRPVGTDDRVDLIKKGYCRLMMDILNQASKDFFLTSNLETQLDALLWLASEDAKLYTESVGLDYDPLEMVVIGTDEYKKRIFKLRAAR